MKDNQEACSIQNLGGKMWDLCNKLFPICRSITGDGVRNSLDIIHKIIPELTVHEVPSGTQAFDWTIPPEWNINDAYIIAPNGDKLCDFKISNLHLVGYSTPVNKTVTLLELQEHLYSLPEQPDAIPYITSYYKERWGFCITQNERDNLLDGEYQVYIDSNFKTNEDGGRLTYGELIIPGESEQEIFSLHILMPPINGK